MLRIVSYVNALLTVIAVAISLGFQQITGMAVRAGNFERFRDRISDGDRDAILNSAAGWVLTCVTPLVITNILWIAIWCFSIIPKPPAKAEPPA